MDKAPDWESDPAQRKARTYFARLLELGPEASKVNVVLIAHIVDSARPFIPELSKHFALRAVYAKRSSTKQAVEEYLTQTIEGLVVRTLDRDLFRDNPEHFVAEVFPEWSETRERVILVDIGGYFAEAVDGPTKIREELARRNYELIGIVEDTENGHKRYLDYARNCKPGELVPVFSVARSPLKKPENHLVGVAVAFSIEAILRQSNVVLQSRRAGVIGFGPIGRGVAHSLRNRGIPVRVCEVDPIRLAIAAAQGFHVHHYGDDFPRFAADLNLIVSSTGAGAHSEGRLLADDDEIPIDERVHSGRLNRRIAIPLNRSTVRFLEPGTYVASVTSSDDEIDVESILCDYRSERSAFNKDLWEYTEKSSDPMDGEIGAQGVRWRKPPHYFHLMLNGNAVNFRDGGVIGPAIQLLQGEIIFCMKRLVERDHSCYPSDDAAGCPADAVRELSDDDRRIVADMWLDQYLVEDMQQG